ncbi:hypothetical protein PR003_g2372 [Phytophthora rubi]|uniref:Uncharacterized protein n=1 Tax=Phytophthora rubi TaxID=129364 RepID=A0A6A4G0D5_9STRA|nr:hypothetical protein PR002_g4216 [Phytophthora rubi]KAE9046745.1 hypothetical protein PR001_g4437 [Phytophthora rubi]KAE9356326.1 hypothetical protein PR003_g2372 [Phytophthora rubi]
MVAQRLKWTNALVAEMLRLRFEEGDVKRHLESADIKTKKALVRQQYASVLSQSQGVVIGHAQFYQKYRKMECLYRKRRVLLDAFASHVGLSGEVRLDTNFEKDGSKYAGEADTSASNTTSPAKDKLQPVVELANALQTGMGAITASMSAAPTGGDHLQQLVSAIRQQARAMVEHRE